MKIGIITYDANHLKTEQVALGLHQAGYDNLSYFALPFVPRPAREIIFAHRPDMSMGAHVRDVAEATRSDWQKIDGVESISPDCADFFLICGAGLLPEKWVAKTLGRVVNSHPGIIPLVRGLDAFKWAIFDRQPIGNSLHFIDSAADAGEVFAQGRTPVFMSDTLESFARRHYELEIQMMVDFESFLDRYQDGSWSREVFDMRPARMRMKPEQQKRLRELFENYKREFAEG